MTTKPRMTASLPLFRFLLGVAFVVAATAARADPAPSAVTADGFLGDVALPLSGASSEPLLFPEFSAQSSDLALHRRPGVGALEAGGDGQPAAAGVLASPAFNLRADSGGAIDRFMREGDTSGDAWDIGGFIGYQYADPVDPRYAAGVNVQVATGTASDAESGWLLQPGIDYTMPFSSSLQLNARVYSTYATEERSGRELASTDVMSRLNTDGSFRDVGLNLGLGYSVGDKWSIETQAGFARTIDDESRTAQQQKDDTANQLFGGVIVNYRF